jgi:hypothetical protein
MVVTPLELLIPASCDEQNRHLEQSTIQLGLEPQELARLGQAGHQVVAMDQWQERAEQSTARPGFDLFKRA